MKRILCFLLIALFLVGCGGEKPKEQKLKVFPMTAQAFIQKYNDVVKVANNPAFLISKPLTDKGKAKTVYEYQFIDDVYIIIVENNEAKKVETITAYSCPNTTEKSAFFVVENASIVAVLHPGTPIENRTDVLKKLKVLGNDNIKGLNETTIVDNVKYTATESNSVVTIMATPK